MLHECIHSSGSLFPPLFLCQDRSCSVDFKVFRALCALVCSKSSVTGSYFLRVRVNVAALEVCLQNVLVPLEGSSLVAIPLLQLSVQQHLRETVVLHSDDVSCPSQLALDDQVTQYWVGRTSPGPGGWTMSCRLMLQLFRRHR